MQNVKEVIKKIAAQEGISEEQCRSEMEKAILAAKNNPDPEKRKNFNMIFDGSVPTPEEFICKMTELLSVKH